MATVRGIGVAVITSTCGRARPGLLPQRVTLLDPEPVLLVDHDHAQLGELHVLGEQGMGADHDPGRAGRRVEQRLAAGRRALRAGQQRDPGRLLRTAQPPRLAERAEQIGDRPVVLLGEHLGRGEQRGLPARVDDLQHRAHSDHRLARTDLALQQPVHGMGAGQVGRDGPARGALAFGEAEREPGVEGVQQPACPWRPGGGGQGRRGTAALGQHGLQHERFVPLEPGPGTLGLGHVGRAVNALQRGREPAQLVTLTQGVRERVVHLAQGVEHHPHALLDVPGREIPGRRVERDQLGGVLRAPCRRRPRRAA